MSYSFWTMAGDVQVRQSLFGAQTGSVLLLSVGCWAFITSSRRANRLAYAGNGGRYPRRGMSGTAGALHGSRS